MKSKFNFYPLSTNFTIVTTEISVRFDCLINDKRDERFILKRHYTFIEEKNNLNIWHWKGLNLYIDRKIHIVSIKQMDNSYIHT